MLELVPSELERLALLWTPEAKGWIGALDAIARSGDEETLVSATDAALIECGALDPDLVGPLGEARIELLEPRLARNERTDEKARPAATAGARLLS